MTDNLEKKRFVSSYLIIDLMTSLMVCFTMISFAVMSLVYFVVTDMSYIHLIFTVIPCTAFVLIRRLRIPQPLMLLLHVLTGVAYVIVFDKLFLTGMKQEIGCIFFVSIHVLALFIHSMTHRYSRKSHHVTFDNLVVLLSVHTVLLAIIAIMGAYDRNFYVLLDSIVIVGLHFAARQLDVFDTKYYHNLHSSTQPIKSMKSQNHYTIVLIFGGIFFALFLLLFMPVDMISKGIQTVIGAVFSFIGMILNYINRWVHGGGDDYINTGAGLTPANDENYEPSEWAEIITVVVIVLLALLFFFVVVTTIRRIIKRFQVAEGTSKVDEDNIVVRRIIKRFQVAEGTSKVDEDNIVVDIIEDVPQQKKSSLFSRRDFGEGYEGKIRKKYYQTVTRAIRSGITVKPATSTRQIEEQIKEKGDQSISELTSLYNSVRYNKKDS